MQLGVKLFERGVFLLKFARPLVKLTPFFFNLPLNGVNTRLRHALDPREQVSRYAWSFGMEGWRRPHGRRRLRIASGRKWGRERDEWDIDIEVVW